VETDIDRCVTLQTSRLTFEVSPGAVGEHEAEIDVDNATFRV